MRRSPRLSLALLPVLLLSSTARAEDETYATLKPVFDECARCHASSLDLRTFPFASRFETQEELVTDMIRRFRLDTWQRMPPPNLFPDALAEDVIERVEAWLAAGLPAE